MPSSGTGILAENETITTAKILSFVFRLKSIVKEDDYKQKKWNFKQYPRQRMELYKITNGTYNEHGGNMLKTYQNILLSTLKTDRTTYI